MTEHFLDASNNNPVTAAVRAQAKAEGIDGIVFNLLDLYPDHTIGELTAARLDGFRRAGYVYVNFPGGRYYAGRVGAEQVTTQLDGIGGEAIEFCAVDVEDPAAHARRAVDNIAYIWAAVKAVQDRGIEALIYTSEGEWQTITGGTTEFADAGIRLWNATASGIDAVAAVDFGGWSTAKGNVWGDQFTWHHSEAGSEFDESVVPGRAAPWNPSQGIPAGFTQEGSDVAIFNKADDQSQAAAELLAAATKASAEVAEGTVYEFQSGALKDEAGNNITIPAGKLGTLLVHDA